MAYISIWELMSPARERVMMPPTGLAKDEAQNDLCQAIADRAVNIRVKLQKHATNGMRSSDVLEGKDLEIPTTLKPEDFDWEQSRPLKPWFVRRGAYSLPGYWHLEKIELCRADVTNALLCTVAPPGGPIERSGREAGAATESASSCPTAGGAARRRGAPPRKFEQVSAAMCDDLRQGRLTPAELKNMLEKNLAAKYGVSRDTARKARNAVLAGEN
jgi:hypothetical protein